MKSLVLVVGATGGTGRLVVEELRERGIPARLFVRNEAQAREILGEGDYVQGDAVTADLAPLMEGVDAVVSALGSREPDGLRNVDLPATARLAAAAKAAGVSRFVLCSTIGAVPTPNVPEYLLKAFAPKGEAEAALRASGVPYTIIRPGRLVDEPMEEPRAIERRFVAKAMVEALSRPEAKDAIYELSQARLAAEGADPVLGLKVAPPIT
jgi:uncharacterized protein YbjT (DUF2867 family)